jgi:hypothetical protein
MIRASFVLCVALAACGVAPTSTPDIPTPIDFACAGGCETDGHDYVGELDEATFDAILAGLAGPENADREEAMDQAVFYGPRLLAWLDTKGAGTLGDDEERALRAQVGRTDVDIELRLTTDAGEVVGSGTFEAPVGLKQHLTLDAPGYGYTTVNGTVVRTAVGHLWSRW